MVQRDDHDSRSSVRQFYLDLQKRCFGMMLISVSFPMGQNFQVMWSDNWFTLNIVRFPNRCSSKAYSCTLSAMHMRTKTWSKQYLAPAAYAWSGAGIMEADDRHNYDDSLHSPAVIPPSALDKPSIMKRYQRRRATRWGVTAVSPTMVTLHDTRFVECRCWNDGWTVKTIVTWRSTASMISAPGLLRV